MYIGTYERAKAGTERRTRRDRAKGKATARAHSGSPAIVILDGFKEVEPKMRERTIAVEVVVCNRKSFGDMLGSDAKTKYTREATTTQVMC
jgi:hypothetical protein